MYVPIVYGFLPEINVFLFVYTRYICMYIYSYASIICTLWFPGETCKQNKTCYLEMSFWIKCYVQFVTSVPNFDDIFGVLIHWYYVKSES